MSCLASARRLLLVLALLAPACSDADTPTPGPGGPDLPDHGLAASCNPLRTAGACALPFPGAVFQEEDAAAESGVRNALVAEVLPRNLDGLVLDPVRLDRIDGFSASSQPLAYFPGRIDPSSLPSRHDPCLAGAHGAGRRLPPHRRGEGHLRRPLRSRVTVRRPYEAS